jgi:flagellar basal-body rod modification protein FlgD
MSVQSILTNIANDTAKVYAEKSQANKGSSTLDQDAFLRLLMTQLQSQDPMNPVDNTAFIAQQAQLSTLSEMQSLNKNVTSSNQMLQASNLIGKDVTLQDPNDKDSTIAGKVTEARISDSGASIVVNNKEYSMNNILSIK